ncbi:histone-lysine N-methyltransferase ATXR3 [Amborella trichopoda]|uniref:SET domain-containing protein n=1 Tax=Amborella trichopoda TaxID=13333 RepID=W1PRV8_AMBTC|nr:histone-lysine N-methyltransferase ATXR3 [Amborella trichopoda]ERN12742.1 hypothetical protein AMTR_s00043p00149000 [Amborella trichopoda]|eukprot:XP_006851161.1 histone-lysine N-methyltransferase ATXR3 [Amborella trichopoda]
MGDGGVALVASQYVMERFPTCHGLHSYDKSPKCHLQRKPEREMEVEQGELGFENSHNSERSPGIRSQEDTKGGRAHFAEEVSREESPRPVEFPKLRISSVIENPSNGEYQRNSELSRTGTKGSDDFAEEAGECDYSRSRGSSSERHKRNSRWDTSRWEPSRWEPLQERVSNSKGNLGNWGKREPQSCARRSRDDYGDYSVDESRQRSKSRRRSDEYYHSEKSLSHSRNSNSNSRQYRDSSYSSSRDLSNRYSRRYDSSSSSRFSYDKHNRSPSYLDRHSNRSPSYSDRSPRDRGRHHDYRDGNRKSGTDKRDGHYSRDSREEERFSRKESNGRDSRRYSSSSRHLYGSRSDKAIDDQHPSSHSDRVAEDHLVSKSGEKKVEDQMENSNLDSEVRPNAEPPKVDGFVEELQSMEEDMDLCSSPEYAVNVRNQSGTIGLVDQGKPFIRGWYYLDHVGIEQGPSKLCELKQLVEDGFLSSDHLIKHSDSDRWVTVENAASPLVVVNSHSVVPETVTQLVNPPEAPGNAMIEVGDFLKSVNRVSQELGASSAALESPSQLEDLRIDERVDALLNGLAVVPGKELESIAEALQTTFEYADWEKRNPSEGFMRFRDSYMETSRHYRDEENNRAYESLHKESPLLRFGYRSGVLGEKEFALPKIDSSQWFTGRWSCKGGDWRRCDEMAHDRNLKRKIVLNEGFPLCQMPKSGYQDPRYHRHDDLYHPMNYKKLELPPWAYCWLEEKFDHPQPMDAASDSHVAATMGHGSIVSIQAQSVKTSNGDLNKQMVFNRVTQYKAVVAKGARGLTQSVVRNNTLVVKIHGSFVSELHARAHNNEFHSLKPEMEQPSSVLDGKSMLCGDASRPKDWQHDLKGSHGPTSSDNAPPAHVLTKDELKLHLGEWHYLDGAGHESHPVSFKMLQDLVANGTIQRFSSVYRKRDNIWVPITGPAPPDPSIEVSGAPMSVLEARKPSLDNDACDSGDLRREQVVTEKKSPLSYFHALHPQFIGYTRGKLHELVMKSYKNREFAAAVNEVLDPWMNARQPKKAPEKLMSCNSSTWVSLSMKSAIASSLNSGYVDPQSEYGTPTNKMESDLARTSKDFNRFGKRSRLLIDESEEEDDTAMDLGKLQSANYSFDDLCGETAFPQETCANIATGSDGWGLLNGHILARIFHFLRADFKSLAVSAVTCKQWNMAVKFYKDLCVQVDLSSMGLNCTDSIFQYIMSGYNKENITSVILMGCIKITARTLEEVLQSFPSIEFIDNRGCDQFRELTTTYLKVKWKKSRGLHYGSETKISDDSHHKIRSLKQINEKSHNYLGDTLRHSQYKRMKLIGTRKASLLDELRMKGLYSRKSPSLPGGRYKKMEHYLSLRLKEIMNENTFAFFIPKVAEIEDRMQSGYYVGRGLKLLKDDIGRMCRDAMKANNRSDDGEDMTHIIKLFMKLVTYLEDNSKSFYGGSRTGFFPAASNHKKKHKKTMKIGKLSKRNIASYDNGFFDSGEYASDRDSRRRLSKLNRRSFDSDTETSDEAELSEEVSGDEEGTSSDSDVDTGVHSDNEDRELSGDRYQMVDEVLESVTEDREWGARMTKASLVPPITRKYEVIDEYVVIADEEYVQRKMRVALPEDYEEKLNQQKSGEEDMEIPEVKDYKPRKKLGDEVLEQEVYGIDPYTHNLLLDTMPEELDWPLLERHSFIEEVILCVLNKQVRHFTGTGCTPMEFPLPPVVDEILKNAEKDGDTRIMKMAEELLKAMKNRPDDNYVAYRKGLGVVCNKEEGFGEDDFVVEFLGEVYPAWKWFEKQDGIRSLQKNNEDPAPEFYNIYLERPKGDRDGYDLVVVDAMHKANYASRICHSCRPNCEAKVTAVDGQYQIGIYTVRPIGYGEEITFDYNSVTESKEEYEASVCLCGSQVCRGSYLNLTGEGAYQKVLKECHGLLNRHQLMLEACEMNFVSQEDYDDLGKAGLGSCLLSGLPDWLIAYSARLVRFINYERTMLPEEILNYNLEEKRKFFSDICLEVEKSDAEVQAEGVYNQRLQNLAVTLDKVRYVIRCIFEDPKRAPPPLERLSPQALVCFLWKGEGSLVEELLQCVAPHVDSDLLNSLKSKIHARDPSGSDDVGRELRKSLLWLRDEIRSLPSSCKFRHDAAADLIHMYAYTRCFFTVRDYRTVTSAPVYISPLDLGPKYVGKLGSGFEEYRKTYGEGYCLGQLIYWHVQTNADPDSTLAKARRGCLALPDISSFYAKPQKPPPKFSYGPKTVRLMMARMEKQPQKPWRKDQIWKFKSTPRVFGSPMLDAIMNRSALDKEMMQWLKTRPIACHAPWDQ